MLIIFSSVHYKRTASNPSVRIQIREASTNGVQFKVSPSSQLFNGVVRNFRLRETNREIATPTTRVIIAPPTGGGGVILPFDISGVILHYDSKSRNLFDMMSFTQPLRANKAYQVVAAYSYRGDFENKVCSWAEQVPVIKRFIPPARTGVATSEWFVVKPEMSGTNRER
jgi:hypothetical protein